MSGKRIYMLAFEFKRRSTRSLWQTVIAQKWVLDPFLLVVVLLGKSVICPEPVSIGVKGEQ